MLDQAVRGVSVEGKGRKLCRRSAERERERERDGGRAREEWLEDELRRGVNELLSFPVVWFQSTARHLLFSFFLFD